MRISTTTIRLVSLVLLSIGLVGCSRGFWDRTPRVGGQYQPAPAAPAPGAQAWTQPAPTVPMQTPSQAPSPCPPAQLRAMPQNVASSSGSCAPTCEEQEILQEVNAIRTSQGLRPFTWAPLLYRAAQDHSREQHQHGYMGHGSPDPNRRTLVQRMQQAGYPGVMYGEVVAWGYRDSRAVVEGWMNSPEHRAILVDQDLTQAGFARIGQYWTGNFGAPRAAPPRQTAPLPCPAPYTGARAPRTASPTYATPTPRRAPRAAPPVQDYFRSTQTRPPPAPVFRPPTRGG